MESAEPGVEVPMPTRPVLVMVKRVDVAKALVVEEMVKRFRFAVLLAAKSERSPYGDEVPMPTLPLFATMKLVALEEPMTNCGAPLRSPFGLIDSWPHGDVDAMPKRPLLVIVRAASDEVAVPATVVVERKRFPPAFLNAHCAKPAPAERESWEPVVEATVS